MSVFLIFKCFEHSFIHLVFNTLDLLNVNDSFLDRNNRSDAGGSYGGKLRTSSFFRGPMAGIFGGIKYTIPNTNFKLL